MTRASPPRALAKSAPQPTSNSSAAVLRAKLWPIDSTRRAHIYTSYANRETGSTVDRAERSARSTQLLPVHVGGRWATHGSSLHASQFHFFSIFPFPFRLFYFFFFFLNFAEFSFANFCVLHFFLEKFFVPVFLFPGFFCLEILCSNFYLQVFPKKTFISKFSAWDSFARIF